MKIRYALTNRNILKYFILSKGYCSKVPATPISTLEKRTEENVKIDNNTLALLERLSLVKCDTIEGVKVLEDSIAFADKILHINTENVKPLYSVLEDENLFLRPDIITQGNCQKDILKNAVLTEDDYFVSPPGNIPLHEVQSEDTLRQELTKQVSENDK
nr:glutamyl-tRNA(Gln) amidotransferase subunit C, mitochondrial [Plodia interpunctella]